MRELGRGDFFGFWICWGALSLDDSPVIFLRVCLVSRVSSVPSGCFSFTPPLVLAVPCFCWRRRRAENGKMKIENSVGKSRFHSQGTVEGGEPCHGGIVR